jgi:type IV pilus assembly PilX-like protein
MKIQRSRNFKLDTRQAGAVLFIALVMLVILSIIGVSAAMRSSMQEKMGGNYHLNNMTESAAESALGGFFRVSNSGNKLAEGHVLRELLLTGRIVNKQFNQQGERVAKGYLDGGDGTRGLVASVDASVVNPCDKTCGGYSIGGDIGCRYYKIKATGKLKKGDAVIQSSEATMWAKEITVCRE